MAQNIVSITITEAQRSALFTAMDQLEQQVADKTIALDPAQRRDLFKMGVKSETFCRQALAALDKNRQVVPASLGLEEALLDLGRGRLYRYRALVAPNCCRYNNQCA